MATKENIIKRLSTLKQYKSLSQEELSKIADEKILEEETIKSIEYFIDDSEKKLATNLLKNYTDENSFTSSSDKDDLNHLIYLEILSHRIKKFIDKESIEKQGSVDIRMIEQLRETNNQILQYKESLGLLSKGKESKSALEEWEKLKQKALIYYKESAGCNICRCPECNKLFYILKDMRGHITEKLPFFKKTLLYNKKLFSLYEEKKLNIEEMSEIIGVSQNYIEYIFEEIYKNDK